MVFLLFEEMNPNHGYPPGGFYSQTGANFGQGPGHGFPGSMSPYGGGPMSPYSQGQGQSPTSGGGGGQQQQPMYGNQNAQYSQQGASSGGGGGGAYPGGSAGGAGQFSNQPYHPQQPMQNYYNNHSPPTHGFPFGGGGGAGHLGQRHPSPDPSGGPRAPGGPGPLGMRMIGGRVPQPLHSPNQQTGPHLPIKTETMDLKAAGGGYAPPPQGAYSQAAGFGYNGFGGGGGGTGGPRPILSPMSPHGRLNQSPGGGGPSLSPREGAGMSPHAGHPYGGGGQASPSNNPISTIASQASTFSSQPPFNAGYNEYFNKQGGPPPPPPPGAALPSPQAASFGGGVKEEPGTAPAAGGFNNDADKQSDAQSNASVPSTNGGDTPQHNTTSDELNIKKEPGDMAKAGGDDGGGGQSAVLSPPPQKQQPSATIKSEKLEGFNYSESDQNTNNQVRNKAI